MTDVKFHLLPAGYKFHIESRVPGKNDQLVAEAPTPVEIKAKVKKAPAKKAAPKKPVALRKASS
jgi:hypothetical protein